MEPLTGAPETSWPADIPRPALSFVLSFLTVVAATVMAFVSLAVCGAVAGTDAQDAVGWDACPGAYAMLQILCLLVPLLGVTFVVGWCGILQHWDWVPPPFSLHLNA